MVLRERLWHFPSIAVFHLRRGERKKEAQMKTWRRMNSFLAVALLAALAGCASTGANLVPGQSTAADVEKSMGRPKEKITNSAGESVWFYTSAPNGQTTYAARMKPDGTVISVDQVLVKENWSKVVNGRTTTKEVRELLGPPSAVSRAFGASNDQWTYKVMNNARQSLLVYDLSPDGGTITKTLLILDPDYLQPGGT